MGPDMNPQGILTPRLILASPPSYMFTAPNPGPMTPDRSNAYLVGSPAACIVDPGPDIPIYQRAFAAWIQRHNLVLSCIALTHAQHDHMGAAEMLRELTGHTPDHLVYWLREERVAFTGDLVLGEGSSLVAPPEGNMKDYLAE